MPAEASSANKTSVSQPYVSRISAMYFMAAQDDKGRPMDVKEPQNGEDQVVLEWEYQQLQNKRLAVAHFMLEVRRAHQDNGIRFVRLCVLVQGLSWSCYCQ